MRGMDHVYCGGSVFEKILEGGDAFVRTRGDLWRSEIVPGLRLFRYSGGDLAFFDDLR